MRREKKPPSHHEQGIKVKKEHATFKRPRLTLLAGPSSCNTIFHSTQRREEEGLNESCHITKRNSKAPGNTPHQVTTTHLDTRRSTPPAESTPTAATSLGGEGTQASSSSPAGRRRHQGDNRHAITTTGRRLSPAWQHPRLGQQDEGRCVPAAAS